METPPPTPLAAHRPETRAPPPSPIAGSTPESDPESDEFDGFLARSRHIPDLILPDRILYREIKEKIPPEIDWSRLISGEDGGSEAMAARSAAKEVGCFQIVKHGIPREVTVGARVAAKGMFGMEEEEKEKVRRREGRRWGFEAEEEDEEKFWWDRREDDEMTRIWRGCYEDFRDKMQRIWMQMEMIATKMEHILKEEKTHDVGEEVKEVDIGEGSIVCLRNYHEQERNLDSKLHYLPSISREHDALQMLMRNWGCSHLLALHLLLCERGEGGFQFYSKRGWVRFRINSEAIIVTVGDQFQVGTGGLYKHAIGKHAFFHSHGDVDDDDDGGGDEEEPISLAFLYSHAVTTPTGTVTPPGDDDDDDERTISLSQQLMIAACLTLLCHLYMYLYTNFI